MNDAYSEVCWLLEHGYFACEWYIKDHEGLRIVFSDRIIRVGRDYWSINTCKGGVGADISGGRNNQYWCIESPKEPDMHPLHNRAQLRALLDNMPRARR